MTREAESCCLFCSGSIISVSVAAGTSIIGTISVVWTHFTAFELQVGFHLLIQCDLTLLCET